MPKKNVEYTEVFKYGIRLVKESSARWPVGETCSQPETVSKFFDHLRTKDREHFECLALDTKNHVLGWWTVSIGSLSASIVHPRELFKQAVKRNAASIILVHNHPSGDPTPSQPDKDLTRRMQRAGEVLGINVYDHVIIGDGYHSMQEAGEM